MCSPSASSARWWRSDVAIVCPCRAMLASVELEPYSGASRLPARAAIAVTRPTEMEEAPWERTVSGRAWASSITRWSKEPSCSLPRMTGAPVAAWTASRAWLTITTSDSKARALDWIAKQAL